MSQVKTNQTTRPRVCMTHELGEMQRFFFEHMDKIDYFFDRGANSDCDFKLVEMEGVFRNVTMETPDHILEIKLVHKTKQEGGAL